MSCNVLYFIESRYGKKINCWGFLGRLCGLRVECSEKKCRKMQDERHDCGKLMNETLSSLLMLTYKRVIFNEIFPLLLSRITLVIYTFVNIFRCLLADKST